MDDAVGENTSRHQHRDGIVEIGGVQHLDCPEVFPNHLEIRHPEVSAVRECLAFTAGMEAAPVQTHAQGPQAGHGGGDVQGHENSPVALDGPSLKA